MDNRNKSDASGPLAGKRIVVTRAPEQGQELARLLEPLGAEVVLLPIVSYGLPDDLHSLDEALHNLDSFDAVLFVSPRSVGFTYKRCLQLGVKGNLEDLVERSAIAVGPATAAEAAKEGLRIDRIAKTNNGEALVEEFRDSIRGRRLLLPRSDKGDERLSHQLRGAGAKVTEVIAYRTGAPDPLNPQIVAQIRRAEVNAIVFASPSAFKNLTDYFGLPDLVDISRRVQFAAIGPTTARALRTAGVSVAIEATEPSSAGLANAIAEYYRAHASTVRHV